MRIVGLNGGRDRAWPKSADGTRPDLSVRRSDGLTSDGKPVFDVLECDRLAIRARYIKLNTTYGGDSCNFAFGNIQTGIRVFQLRSEFFAIQDVYPEDLILTWGKNKVYLELAVPEGRRAFLVSALGDGAQVRNEQTVAASPSNWKASTIAGPACPAMTPTKKSPA